MWRSLPSVYWPGTSGLFSWCGGPIRSEGTTVLERLTHGEKLLLPVLEAWEISSPIENVWRLPDEVVHGRSGCLDLIARLGTRRVKNKSSTGTPQKTILRDLQRSLIIEAPTAGKAPSTVVCAMVCLKSLKKTSKNWLFDLHYIYPCSCEAADHGSILLRSE